MQGARITFAQQVHNFMKVVEKLNSTVGSDSTSRLISRSIFYISIGSNDFLHNYLLNYTAAEINHNGTVEPIDIYSSQLVLELSKQIQVRLRSLQVFLTDAYAPNCLMCACFKYAQSLYLVGAQRFAVMGVGPLGCTPHYLYAWDSKDGSCIAAVNNLVQKFNEDLRKEVNTVVHNQSAAATETPIITVAFHFTRRSSG